MILKYYEEVRYTICIYIDRTDLVFLTIDVFNVY